MLEQKHDTFYKGFMQTENKIPKGKITNPSEYKTYADIQALNPTEYAGILSENAVLIDFDDAEMSDIALRIVVDNKVNCRAIKTTRGLHLLFKGDKHFEKSYTGWELACGLSADIKLGKKNGIEILKKDGKEREIIYDTGKYDTPPTWFRPLKGKKDEFVDFMNMESGDGRNSKLYSYLIKLSQIMTKEECKDTVRLINGYVLKDKLSEGEIRTITRDEAFEKIKNEKFFGEKGQFYFDNFAKSLLDEGDIVKIDGQLRTFKDGIYVTGEEWIERQMIEKVERLNQSKRKEVLSYLNLIINDDKSTSDYAQYIVFNNCVYDAIKDETMPHSRDLVVTNKIPWDYNPDAYSADIDEMLNKLSCDDEKVRMILEEMIGYCFFRRNELGKAFILVGPQANGKSTFQAVLQKLLGRENIASMDLKELNERFKPAELYGKLANIGDDISDKYIDDNNMFKTIVTGGRILAERKGKDPFEFEPYAKCIFSSNNIPKTRDKTGAIKRRLIIVPFDRVFSPDDPDYRPYLKYEIINGTEEYSVEENMSYLINLGIKGLRRILATNKFTESDRVEEKIEEYDKENNPIKIWFDEFEDPETELCDEPTNEVFNLYSDFCLANNFKQMSKSEFSKALKNEFGFTTKSCTVNKKSMRIYTKG